MDNLELLKQEIMNSEYAEKLGSLSDEELMELVCQAETTIQGSGSELTNEDLEKVNGGMKIILPRNTKILDELKRIIEEMNKKRRQRTNPTE